MDARAARAAKDEAEEIQRKLARALNHRERWLGLQRSEGFKRWDNEVHRLRTELKRLQRETVAETKTS